jgi:hypothetical protein
MALSACSILWSLENVRRVVPNRWVAKLALNVVAGLTGIRLIVNAISTMTTTAHLHIDRRWGSVASRAIRFTPAVRVFRL